MMTTIDGSARIGLAEVARAAFVVLTQTVNEAIEQENEHWVPLDEKLAEFRGIDYSEILIEEVGKENFYLGHNPSLIEAPLEKYPNVAVDSDRAGSSGSDDLDQGSMFGNFLYIEFMVKSEKSEEEVSARAMRMLDAINSCMMANRTLGGTAHELSDTPTAQLSDVFVRDAETRYGDRWYWRGGRIEYTITKLSMIPAGSGLTAADFAGIDQV